MDAKDNGDHDKHRVLSIRGAAYCDSDCVFCVEKHNDFHYAAPGTDATRAFIREGAGKYNMLFFMNGEPTRNRKLFEYVAFAKEHGFKYFGMSSHFRTFADPRFALRTLDAGFEYFDISLHAATLGDQLRVNPIGDGGRSLHEALHGLRNVQEVARRIGKRARVTHKIVISRLNYTGLLPIVLSTYRLGVRSFILQPVKTASLSGPLPGELAITEEEFIPHLNELIARVEGSEARIKLYGMSRIGVRESPIIEPEINVIRHAHGKWRASGQREDTGLIEGSLVRKPAASARVAHRVTVQVANGDISTFECREDELILDAALSQGVSLSFGCRMGSCGACCGQIVEGTVEQAPQAVLTERHLRAGYRLLCQSRPRSDLIISGDKEEELGL